MRRDRLEGAQAWRWLPPTLLLLLAFLLLSLAGCGGDGQSSAETASPSAANEEETASANESGEESDLILASTTSTQDSGLFDELIPAFERANPQYLVKVIAVGSGEAIRLGEEKAADVLLVHSPAGEKEFIEKGLGLERRDVMYNDFIVAGPPEDPAGVKGAAGAAEAFGKIARAPALFVSRGDESGTHQKELSLWEAAGVQTFGSWYKSAGQGMGEILRISSEKGAYTLSDRATYLTNKESLDLVILLEGDRSLFNQYGVIPVVGADNPAGARAFTDWVTSDEAQELIAGFGVETYGEPLFVPNAG